MDSKNEGYVIDGLNRNTLVEDKKRKLTYVHRALTLLVLCQEIKIKDYNFNVPSRFHLQSFKLKECVIPPQKRWHIMRCNTHDGYIPDLHSRETCQELL